MKKLVVSIVYIVFLVQAGFVFANSIKSLIFPIAAKITSDSLYFNITDMRLEPNNIEIKYDENIKRFPSVILKLAVETNILSSSLDKYSYNLTLESQTSKCMTYNDEVESYDSPDVSIVVNGRREKLSLNPSSSLDFSSNFIFDSNEYLSDERNIYVDFHEPQPDKLIKNFKYCDGEFSLVSGLSL
ncbi:TPA: hypothetical protein ACX6QA_004305 [Photobacterium damselae]